MRIKSILLLLVCFLLSGFTLSAIACPPPPCPGCCYWNGSTCWPDNSACEDCESCISCECESDCLMGQCCSNDACVNDCPSGECCDDGECVPKCTNSGQCDYGELPSGPYPNCQVLKDDSTGKCEQAEGLICGHNINISTNDAECADCAPGCAKSRICACAEIIPYRCTEHCYLLFCDCTCDEKYEERTYRGDHYECD
jgi:hypothetical protein